MPFTCAYLHLSKLDLLLLDKFVCQSDAARPIQTPLACPSPSAMLARRAFAPYLGPLCRSNLSTSDASFARHANSGPSPKSRGVQQPQPGNSVAVSNTTPNEVAQTAEQWAEVVDKPSGQVYYWNQQTGAFTCSRLLVTSCHA